MAAGAHQHAQIGLLLGAVVSWSSGFFLFFPCASACAGSSALLGLCRPIRASRAVPAPPCISEGISICGLRMAAIPAP